MRIHFNITILLLALFFSCRQELPLRYEIPQMASQQVDDFFNEAETRGFQFEKENLVVILSDSAIVQSGNYLCGNSFGPLTGDIQHMVSIDTQCLAWRYNALSREILIFHELGHIFLERNHLEVTLPNGDFKSIMTGSSWEIRDFYTEAPDKRAYYLDELFDPGTDIPDWAR